MMLMILCSYRKKEIDDLLMVLMQDLENGVASSSADESDDSEQKSDRNHSSGDESDFDVVNR